MLEETGRCCGNVPLKIKRREWWGEQPSEHAKKKKEEGSCAQNRKISV
jgi:hypothetical protein